MPRFFFDFRQGDARSTDVEGIELPNAEQAYLEAVEAMREMWSELLWKRQDPRRCAFEVRGEAGDTLFTLPFQEVRDNCTDARKTSFLRTFNDAALARDKAERARANFLEEIKNTRRVLRESRDLLRQHVEEY